MNEYKQAWMMAVDILPQTRHSDRKPEQDSSGRNFIMDTVQDSAVDLAIITGLTYMATNTFANPYLRGTLATVGKIGIRVLPVVGALALAYTAYKFFED